MQDRRALGLRFGRDVADVVRRRITYAFTTFCAVYGYEPLFDDAPSGCVRLCYGHPASDVRDVTVAARYDARPFTTPAPAPVTVALPSRAAYTRTGIARVPAFHASADGRDVDWLGEIFEWLSCADEYAVTARDDVGRIPFAASVHARYGLDPTIPYAAIAMLELNARIPEGYGRAQSPTGRSDVVIAATHDLDYLPLGALDKAKRLAKNAAYAASGDRDLEALAEIAKATVRGVMTWRFPLDCVDEIRARERAQNIHSTWNVICSNAHRRDANYRLDDPRVHATLAALHADGMELAVHGSYTSLHDDRLASEVRALSALGYPVAGVRAHWLRYAGDTLFDAVERIGLIYDSTVGYSDHVGFRAGAAFPYAPYNTREERRYRFVEVPLVIMDGALYEHARATNTDPAALCRRVLDMTESFGWGGVSVLWHNTVFGGGHLPPRYGDLYWAIKRPSHRWLTTKEVAMLARQSSEPLAAELQR